MFMTGSAVLPERRLFTAGFKSQHVLKVIDGEVLMVDIKHCDQWFGERAHLKRLYAQHDRSEEPSNSGRRGGFREVVLSLVIVALLAGCSRAAPSDNVPPVPNDPTPHAAVEVKDQDGTDIVVDEDSKKEAVVVKEWIPVIEEGLNGDKNGDNSAVPSPEPYPEGDVELAEPEEVGEDLLREEGTEETVTSDPRVTIISTDELFVSSNVDISTEYELDGDGLAQYVERYFPKGSLNITITENRAPAQALREVLDGIDIETRRIGFDNTVLPENLATLIAFGEDGSVELYIIMNPTSRFSESELAASGMATLAYVSYAQEPAPDGSGRVQLDMKPGRAVNLLIGTVLGWLQNRHKRSDLRYDGPVYIDETQMWEIIDHNRSLLWPSQEGDVRP